MKLEFIHIENFRQFYGVQQAEFATEDKLNVSVFHGVNGAGKTSLFSAINWCLYEDAIGDIGDLISRQSLAEVEDGQEVAASVSLAFQDQGYRYIAKREIRGKKEGKKAVGLREDASLTRVTTGGDTEIIPNMIGTMNDILPSNVRPYFFFDGEKMDDLTKAESTEVEEAIRNFVRLPALERAERHLHSVATDFRRELGEKGSQELEKFIKTEENLREEKLNHQKRLEEVKKEIKLARGKIQDLENKLKESEDAQHFQEKREVIRNNLIDLENAERNAVLEIQDLANRSFTKFLSPVIDKAILEIDEKRERGEIPSGIREQFLKDLLELRECICGRTFDEGDEVHEKLNNLLTRSLPSGLETEVLNLGGALHGLSTSTSGWLAKIDNKMKNRESYLERMESLRREEDEIERKLREMPLEEIAGLERNRNKFQQGLELNLQEEGSLSQKIEDIDSEIEAVRKKVKDAEAKQERLKLLGKKEDLAQRAADAVARIKEEFIEVTRSNVESATKEVFDSLAWKKDHFQDITIGSDFRMEVIDRWGTPTRRELSAGERQVLSLAFICAMVKVTGEEAPLVMDTPFGRLSRNHLEPAAKNLPKLTSQLILFVTDREWDKASSTQLEPHVGAQYELQFKDGCTEIKEIV